MAQENDEVKKDLSNPESVAKGGASGNPQPQTSGPLAKGETWLVTGVGVALLVLLSFIYIHLHYSAIIPSYDKDAAKKFFLSVGMVKAAVVRSPLSLQEIVDAVKRMPDEGNDVLTSEFKERISSLKGYTANFAVNIASPAKVGQAKGSSSSIPQTKSGSDTLAITQTDQRIVKIKDDIDKIEKEAFALSKNDGFFWISGRWRWLEIVFWGEFGIIIGILAWVCSQAEKGNYTKEMFEDEKYWYLVEVFMGPIVVMAVFFLLKQFIGAFMSGVTEEDVRGSIYMTLGISFTLGLFIRRTLGIFDFIKDKLPLPKALEDKGVKVKP